MYSFAYNFISPALRIRKKNYKYYLYRKTLIIEHHSLIKVITNIFFSEK